MPAQGLLRALFVAVVAVLGLAGGVDAQPQYRIVDLGLADQSGASGPLLNQSGQAAVVSRATGVQKTYLVDASGVRTDIGSLFGSDTFPQAINAAGAIVGQSAEPGAGGTFHAFLWAPGQGMRDLAGPNSVPFAINSAGDVVGEALGPRGSYAFVFTGGQTYDINTLSVQGGGPWTAFYIATGINDAGQIYGVGGLNGYTHAFLLLPVSGTGANLLLKPGFEEYAPPALAAPGWVSDPGRQVAAKSETNQPHRGAQDGACWATTDADCGMYQEVVAPSTGTYTVAFYANADRTGGDVGVNVNDSTVAWQAVEVRGFGNYGAPYTMTFTATQGDTIRVWMFSPATPGYVVIDDVSLTAGQ